jgi:hypothetical protein
MAVLYGSLVRRPSGRRTVVVVKVVEAVKVFFDAL